MREIKFRAWNKELKEYTNINNMAIDPMSRDVIEQYTGIKDKHGVYIYEGDIVKLHVVILSPDDKVGEIKYSPAYGYSIYFTSNRMARQEYWATGDKHTIEVIGNIHTDADLLEG